MCIRTAKDEGAPTGCGLKQALRTIHAQVMDAGQCARASGIPLAATHLMVAARSLANAQSLLPDDTSRQVPAPAGTAVQRVRLWTGEPIGLTLASDEGGRFGERVFDDPGHAGLLPPAIAPHDLGWELLTSHAAHGLALDEVDAALLAHALAQTCWIDPRRRCRWSTSLTGAATLVRLLRKGAPFPLLDPSGPLMDARSARLLEALGWQPCLVGNIAGTA